jgi:hypothetical protein
MTKKGLVTEAVDTKVTTRQTYVLTGIEGDLVQKDGKLTFLEKVRPPQPSTHIFPASSLPSHVIPISLPREGAAATSLHTHIPTLPIRPVSPFPFIPICLPREGAASPLFHRPLHLSFLIPLPREDAPPSPTIQSGLVPSPPSHLIPPSSRRCAATSHACLPPSSISPFTFLSNPPFSPP